MTDSSNTEATIRHTHILVSPVSGVFYVYFPQVTLVHNLETFGIDPEEFAHDVQVHMACSSSVSPLPGKSQAMEVLIQGNQINYIASVLIGKCPRR